MTISVFDKFQNMIPTTVFDGGDVSMVILIDPPEIPAPFMRNKGVLRTTDKKIYIYGDDGSTVVHTFDISTTDLKPINEEISALKTRVGANEGDIAQLKIDVSGNAALLVDALIKDDNGWNVDNLNIYNVSRLSRTNSTSSNGMSIGDNDVNLHGDIVGVTSGNGFTTYAVFSAGGLNINDFPLTRMGSGGDTDTNGANIGDVKRISTSGSGLKPVDETWDMLGYTVLNVGTSEEVTSAANVGQVNAVKTVADAADTLSKANATRIDNLPPAPDLSKYAELLTDVAFHQVNATGLDFSDSDTTATIEHNHNINVTVGNVNNVAFKSTGMKLLRDVDGNNHSLTAMGDIKFNSGYQIEGSSTGNLKIRNADGLYKNDSTNNNSVRFEDDDLKFKAAHHMFFKNASDSQIFGVSDAGANLFNHNIIKVKHLTANSAGSMNIAGVKLLKRDDAQDAQQSIQLNSGDITAFSDKHEWKTNSNARRLTIENHVADWHDCKLANVADAVDGEDVPNLAQVEALIAAGGGGGIEFKVVKKGVTGSPTYIYHEGNNHMYIEYEGNAGTIALDTMRNNTPEQAEDMFVVHNKTDKECYIRLFFDGASVVHGIAPRSYTHGWANRVIGEWVVTAMKDPNFVPAERVVRLEDLSVQANSDPRQVTKNIIAAMPNHSVMVAKHNPNVGTSKYRFINNGEKNKVEGMECIAIIAKDTSGNATGMSTTIGGSGKSWSRVLDGSRGCWFTNDTANTRMASVDIDPSEYQENQLFFTTDQGLMETYIEDDDSEFGVVKLRAIAGYNTPKNEADIAALGVQTEKNRSVTHYFINETSLSYDWPDSERKPLVEVQVLNTTQTINNSNVTVTDNNDGKYSGTYNAVGAIAINSSGNWANVYTYHNAYKHDSQDYYVVFNQSVLKWQIIESANPHTSIGEHAAAVTITLGDASSLPASFGDYEINPNFDNIDSLEFMTAEVPVQYDDANSTVIINFNGAKPSGYVVLK